MLWTFLAVFLDIFILRIVEIFPEKYRRYLFPQETSGNFPTYNPNEVSH